MPASRASDGLKLRLTETALDAQGTVGGVYHVSPLAIA